MIKKSDLNKSCIHSDDGVDCSYLFTCCDCGGNDCGCYYCWSCKACESCKELRET